MTKFEALVSLNLIGDIGGVRLKKLLEFFDKPQDILKASCEKLMGVSGIGKKIAAKINSFKSDTLDKELGLAKKFGLKIITRDDLEYPQNLKDIYDPPIALYVKGNLKEEDKFSIGLVGSRRASIYGLMNAQKFAFQLSAKGFTIVSGMARGIDTYSHRGALKQKGRTIAVMGSGFNHIYPPENRELSEEISRNGAVISEFPVNTMPEKQNFPRRNRLISGLSLGLLVAEAAKNSGALITADFALEQGREVFAMPGKVDSETSFGTNNLIKQGAKLISCVDDILEELLPLMIRRGWHEIRERKSHEADGGDRVASGESRGDEVITLDKEENRVFALMSEEKIQLDELVKKTNMDVSRISDILLKLQMKRLIKQVPGKHFVSYKPKSL